MKQRTITGVIFALLFTAFFLPAYWFPITAVLMSLVVGSFVIYELIKALKHGGYDPSTSLIVSGCTLSVLVLTGGYFLSLSAESCLALYSMVIGMFSVACGILIPVARKNDAKALENGIATGGTIFYVTFPLFCLDCAMLFLPEGCNGWYYMLIGLVAPWVSDVFAYLVGVTIGKHKIVPHISPKKSWEGCIGGAFFCAVGVMLYSCLIIHRVDNIEMNIIAFGCLTFFMGLLVSVMSQLGDWFASVIKRHVGIKDYGTIFPGHGGMLDRFDSAFFTMPLGLLLAVIANNIF
ncbi:MAG: phosphatidate cytidylyltransferase [Clostridiales bacterium]|nr:phosphatidate cytidylyltransferase [Clostridiales bacterium]